MPPLIAGRVMRAKHDARRTYTCLFLHLCVAVAACSAGGDGDLCANGAGRSARRCASRFPQADATAAAAAAAVAVTAAASGADDDDDGYTVDDDRG